MNKIYRDIFKSGSKTYYNSSLFFPEHIQKDVLVLYAFVRTADNFVDAHPQKKDEFYEFWDMYKKSLSGKPSNNVIIDGFVELSNRLSFEHAWTDAFLKSMEMDLYIKQYHSMNELLHYIYGSAEVIGLFMSKIMSLPPEAYPFSRLQGRAMQLINFIRDVNEDYFFNRTYLPLDGTGLLSLSKEEAYSKKEIFYSFILKMTDIYTEWQMEAEKGYDYIPKKYLIPIKTAAEMYKWTMNEIRKKPFVIYEKKIKPSKFRIMRRVLWNWIKL